MDPPALTVTLLIGNNDSKELDFCASAKLALNVPSCSNVVVGSAPDPTVSKLATQANELISMKTLSGVPDLIDYDADDTQFIGSWWLENAVCDQSGNC